MIARNVGESYRMGVELQAAMATCRLAALGRQRNMEPQPR